ncbi:MAG: phytoene/squalene synthase family protein [Archangium gephyra]|uniref:Phytoene/squalene synthase family protein n=1 Tax=Archangium gephyra TaxID=48 RepID=A0A2W5UGD2_9BACT|nr:MAG: phytoene/squalene synthase family protein [Archangium gephyra]
MTGSALALGYRSAQGVTRHHAKSFYFSSAALFGHRRLGAYALYAFCRRLDDVVDAPTPGVSLTQSLDRAHGCVRSVFGGHVLPETPWPENEQLALIDTVKRFGIAEQPFHDLIAGMEMDTVKSRYASWAELDGYCYRAAGTVGLMMAPLLGTTDAVALKHADDLGRAMQLTNILRDVKEDLGRGRVYLPQDELAAHGVTEEMLARGVVTDAWRSFARFQIARARALYASGEAGARYLPGFSAPRVVRLLSSIYGGILDIIEQRDFDVFSQRASVSKAGKFWRLLKVALLPAPRHGEAQVTPSSPRISS